MTRTNSTNSPGATESLGEWPKGLDALPKFTKTYVCPTCSSHSTGGSCPRGHGEEVGR